jgi:hypothetical protein
MALAGQSKGRPAWVANPRQEAVGPDGLIHVAIPMLAGYLAATSRWGSNATQAEMTMDMDDRKRLYNACNPSESLEPTDHRYLDIAATPHATDVRGQDWVAQFRRELLFSDEPLCKLVTGLQGCGKSTEFRRLAHEVADPHQGGMLAVYIDAEARLDLSGTVDVVDILATVVEAVEAEVLGLEGGRPGKALEDGYLSRLWHWLKTTDATLTAGEFSVGDATMLTLELKARPSLRAQVRKAINSNLRTFVEGVHNELRQLTSRAHSAGRVGGVLVLYDSLEKLRGTSSSYVEVLESCERLFAQGAAYLRLPVHVIYTVPPALQAQSALRGAAFFPMIKVRHQNGEPYEPGLQVARALVQKRVADAELAVLLGANWSTRLDELLLWSGGFPREIVRFLREIVLFDSAPTDNALRGLRDSVTAVYRDLIRTEAYPWLAQVAVTKQITTSNEAERKIADRLLANGAVFRYVNGGDWWDLHPAVRAIEGVDSAIAKHQASGR